MEIEQVRVEELKYALTHCNFCSNDIDGNDHYMKLDNNKQFQHCCKRCFEK